MKIFAETERLLFREILPEDLEGMYALDSDPEVHKYLGNQPVKDKQTISAVIEMIRQQYIDNGIGRWAVIEKQSNEFVGWAGLKLVKEETNGHTDFYDLGYRFRKKFWGKGIGQESASVSLNYAFNTMGLDVIYASAHIENIGSNQILRKAGFTFIETFNYEDDIDNWYRLRREEWLSEKE